MERKRYGDTDMRVSSIAYGAMSIRNDPALHAQIAPSLLEALEGGINLIDTARAYGDSEAIVAATLKEWKGERPFISTKIAPLNRETFRFYRPLREAYTARASALRSRKVLPPCVSRRSTSCISISGTISGPTNRNGWIP